MCRLITIESAIGTKVPNETLTSFKEKITSSAPIPFPCLITVPVTSTGSSSSANNAQDMSPSPIATPRGSLGVEVEEPEGDMDSRGSRT